MDNILGKKFTFASLLKFSMPSIVGMIFMSLYTIVDGIFVARIIGTEAISAVNIVIPYAMITCGIGVMLGTGGSAVVALKLGEGKKEEANRKFALIVIFGVAVGILFAVLSNIFASPIVRMLGASDLLYENCLIYLKILTAFAPAYLLQVMFQVFFVTAGRPGLGMFLTILAGCVNAFCDYLFMAVFRMGIAGAAWGTVLGYIIPAAVGVIFFMKNRGLKFEKPLFDGETILKSCSNGSSEMVSNLAMSVVNLMFNWYMIKMAGEKGVAAISIVLYAQFVFHSIYIGFSNGVAPVISYNYGEQNFAQLKRLYRICMKFIVAVSIIAFAASLVFAKPIASVFTGNDLETFNMAIRGIRIFAFSYLFAGVNVFASGFFTALSNGKISATISFMRTFVFVVIAFAILPFILGIDGVWLAVPVAEVLAFVLALFFMVRKRTYYHYA